MNRYLKITFVLFLTAFCFLEARPQGGYINFANPDSAFISMRQQAFEQNYDSARDIGYRILSSSPEYKDVIILIGRTYAWENKYRQARTMFSRSFRLDSKYYDGLDAMSDLELWTKNYDSAIGLLNYGLVFYPYDSHFLIKKARIYDIQKEYKDAYDITSFLVKKYPKNRSALQLSNTIKNHIATDGRPLIDDWFSQARNYAYNKRYDSSEILLNRILDIIPDFYSAKIFQARTYAWQSKYDSCRTLLNEVFKVDPTIYSAIDVAIDNEFWAEDYDTAIGFCKHGLSLFPDDTNFLVKKTRLFFAQGDCERTIYNCKYILKRYPDNYRVKEIFNQALRQCRSEVFEFEYLLEYYKIPSQRRFHYFSVRYGRTFPNFFILPRLNFGDLVRNNESLLMEDIDFQLMVDFYPKLWEGAYAFLSYGYSPKHSLFPLHRIDGEVYQDLGKGAEISLGWRYMQFYRPIDSATPKVDVFIITGALSKYFSNNRWWLSVRPYISPRWSVNSQALFLELRRLFDGDNQFASLYIGSGSSPDEFLNQIGDYSDLRAFRLRFGYKSLINNRLSMATYLGYTYKEYQANSFHNEFDFNVIFSYPF